MPDEAEIVSVAELSFPVVLIDKGGMDPRRNVDELTTAFRSYLDSGFLDGAEIVDSAGRTFKVLKATRRKGVGGLFGFSLLHSRRVRVELDIRPLASPYGLADFRARVLKSIRTSSGWESAEGFDEIQTRLEASESFRALIERLAEVAFPPP